MKRQELICKYIEQFNQHIENLFIYNKEQVDFYVRFDCRRIIMEIIHRLFHMIGKRNDILLISVLLKQIKYNQKKYSIPEIEINDILGPSLFFIFYKKYKINNI